MALTAENTVFYSTANAGYAIYAATSLLGIRKYIPDAKLYILSSGLSDYDKKILIKHDIEYHELDLTHMFTKAWEYPVDCYYLFAGPEIFQKQGYDYSVYVDGDILCKSSPLTGVNDVECVAGVESTSNNGDYTSIFGKDWTAIKSTWDLSSDMATRKRINAGVVYFNNASMANVGLLQKAKELFKKSLANEIPRKGDDSLFSLLQYVYLTETDVKILTPQYNYVLQFHEAWRYPVRDLVFFHFSLDKPWKLEPYNHNSNKLDIFNPYVKEWRSQLRIVAPAAWVRNIVARWQCVNRYVEVIGLNYKRARRLFGDQVLWVCGLKKSLRIRRSNFRKRPLKLYWWRSGDMKTKNFGDEITSDIIDRIFGYRCVRSKIEECEFIGAGSIIDIAVLRKADNKIKVWGSGFIKQKDGDDALQGLEFCAVRGKSTLSRINSSVPLGDPGLLANLVYECAGYKSHKIGVIVHYIEVDLPIVDKIRLDPRFVIINPLDSPEDVARNISSCSLVLSSSLHGLIFSDSFNVPNVHIMLSDRLVGGLYKFKDYYSAIGKEYQSANTEEIFNDNYLDSFRLQYRPIRKLLTIQRDLIKSFPYVDQNL